MWKPRKEPKREEKDVKREKEEVTIAWMERLPTRCKQWSPCSKGGPGYWKVPTRDG